MACNTTLSAITKGCENNFGGLKQLYIIPAEFILTSTVTGGGLTAMSLTGSNRFQAFEFNKGGASYTEPSAISLETGSTIINQTISLTIPRRDLAKRNSIMLLASGQRNLVIIGLDWNGIYWIFGLNNYCNLTELGEGSGVAKADGSKYSLTFVAEEAELAYVVNSSLISSLI